MARLFVTGINLNKNELQNARIQNLSAAPSSPVLGQIYYDTSNNTMYYHNGLEAPNGPWMPMSGSTEVITDVILGAVKGGTALTEVTDDANNTITLNLDNTAVTPGSYGSGTEIPTFTVDAQGRLTAAGTASVATNLSIAADTGTADTVSLLTDTFTISGGEGIDTAVTNNTITISGEDATISNKGIASFADADFTVSSGAVSIKNVNLGTQTTGNYVATVAGTANEIEVSGSGSETAAVTIGLPDNVTITTDLTVGQDINLTRNVVFEGSTANEYETTLTVTDPTADRTITLPNNTGTVILDVNTVNSLSAPTASFSMNSQKITDLAEPINPQDAATKNYVDSVAQGLHIHEAAHAATTASLASITGGSVTYDNGTAGVGATLTLENPLTILDGHTLNNGDRILVKDEITGLAVPSHNGIYVRTSSTVLTRADDFNTAAEIHGGDFVFVENGTLYNSTGWVNENEVNTVGTDSILWLQFSGVGTFTAGAGLALNGTTFSVDVTPTSGNASLINTGGATEVKTDTSRGLSVDANGLGINAGTGLTFNAGALSYAAGYGVRKYATSIGDNSATSITVTHSFGTKDVTVHVYEVGSPFAQVEADIEHTTNDTVTVKFATAPTLNEYRVVVVG